MYVCSAQTHEEKHFKPIWVPVDVCVCLPSIYCCCYAVPFALDSVSGFLLKRIRTNKNPIETVYSDVYACVFHSHVRMCVAMRNGIGDGLTYL